MVDVDQVQVYKAYNRKSKRVVAIKRINCLEKVILQDPVHDRHQCIFSTVGTCDCGSAFEAASAEETCNCTASLLSVILQH